MWQSPILLVCISLMGGCARTAQLGLEAHTEQPDSPMVQQILAMTDAEWRKPSRSARATELLDLVRQEGLSRNELDLIYARSAEDMIKARSSWPGDYSWRIRVSPPIWFQITPLRWIVVARSDQPNQFSHELTGHAVPSITGSDGTLEMGLLDTGSDTTEISVELIEYVDLGVLNRVIWSGRVDVPVRVRDNLGKVVAPVSAEILDERVRDTLSVTFFGGKYALLRLSRPFPLYTLALRIEVLFEEEPVALGRAWYRNGWWGDPFEETAIELQKIRPGVSLDAADGRLSVRVSGDGEFALRDFGSNRYWGGSFEKPLSEFTIER